jgi:hypothetical protein
MAAWRRDSRVESMSLPESPKSDTGSSLFVVAFLMDAKKC